VRTDARSPRVPKTLRTSAKKFSLPNRRTRQNQLIRTNRSRRPCLASTPARTSSPTPCPPCLCALCVKFPFPASLFIVSFAPETRLVAQGAAPFAGPEAFSCRIFPHDLWRMPQAAKPRIICTYAKRLRNSRRISTSISKGLKHDWNQHLQKTWRGATAANVSCAKRLPTGCAFRGRRGVRSFAAQRSRRARRQKTYTVSIPLTQI
jgi:hypothetical protein